MKKEKVFGIVGSLLIHLSVIIVFLVRAGQAPAVEKEREDGDDELRGKRLYVEVMVTPLPNPEDGLGNRTPDEKCPVQATYRGIGISHTAGDLVTEVAQGGPADKAGIRIGDHILNRNDLGANKYPLGKRIPVRIQRGERIFVVIVTIGKICYE